MGNKVIIGIHSNVGKDNSLTDGHAWITVTRNTITTTYGLWPDNHPGIIRSGLSNPKETDIRKNFKYDYKTSKYSRYCELTTKQAAKLEKRVQEHVKWGYLRNCSHWAGDIFNDVTNQKIGTAEYLIISTPRELGKNIDLLEKKYQKKIKTILKKQNR